MRLSEYFGMKVCYSTLKMKEHVFHRLAEFFFVSNGELLKITLQFHKNCQNIFQHNAVFYQIYIFSWFSFHVMMNFYLYRMIREDYQNFKNWENGSGFSENFEKGFYRKGHLQNFYLFFGALSIIWTTYSPSLAFGKQFLPIEKPFFEKKSNLLIFFKNYRRKEKHIPDLLLFLEKNDATSYQHHWKG